MQAKLEVLKTRLQKLIALEDPGPEVARQRGRDFESLLLDLFTEHSLLVRRSYHTADGRAEQIDGAIEILGRVVLVEAKWVSSGLAASELFAFLGKVEGKFVGTIGIFISYHELSPNFINALRAGRRQSILVIHGSEDISRIFEPSFALRAYLETYMRRVSTDNIAQLAAESFTAERASEIRAEASASKVELQGLLEQLGGASASARAIAVAEDPSRLEVKISGLLEVYPKLLATPSAHFLRTQVNQYLTTAVPRLERQELQIDRKCFHEILPQRIFDLAYTPVFSAFATRFSFLTPTARITAENVLLAAWDDSFGLYEKENVLATITAPLWPHLTQETKRKLFHFFITIVNSDRRSGFQQVELAMTLLHAQDDADLRDEVLQETVQSEVTKLLGYEGEDGPSARKWIKRSFTRVFDLIPEETVSRIIATSIPA